MGRLSQGTKAGLAAGLILGAMIGLLHFGTLYSCSNSQLGFINSQLLSRGEPANITATSILSTDVIYLPMLDGLWAFIYGIFFGLMYALFYPHIPGKSSREKGIFWGIPVFLVGFFVGPMAILYSCQTNLIPILTTASTLPASLAFGYLLGTFFDAFGRLAKELKEEIDAFESRKPIADH